jgi:hypothetical protein
MSANNFPFWAKKEKKKLCNGRLTERMLMRMGIAHCSGKIGRERRR